jgi:hypothetical protein
MKKQKEIIVVDCEVQGLEIYRKNNKNKIKPSIKKEFPPFAV